VAGVELAQVDRHVGHVRVERGHGDALQTLGVLGRDVLPGVGE